MPQLTPIELEDGTIIYIQASDNIETPTPGVITSISQADKSKELDFLTETPHESVDRALNIQGHVQNSFQAIQNTVRAYTINLVKSFKDITIAEVSEVTLEFGVNIGGVTGIPYIATGKTDCNVKITVKCEFGKSPQTK